MNIPEKLLQLSNKELKKVLTPDKYKAKYFSIGELVVEVLANIKNSIIFNVISSYSKELDTRNKKSFFETYTPLTIEQINKFKTAKIAESLNRAAPSVVLKYLDSCVNKLIDKEYYDITTNTANTECYLRIHYPEIQITNSVEQKHTLRDVFLKLTFNLQNGFWLNSISLARTTYTLEEWKLKYVFSHLNSSMLDNYQNSFCYGTGTPISNAVRNIIGTNIGTQLSGFLIMFREYLGWESIEGTPYSYIGNLINSEALQTVNLVIAKESEAVIEGIKAIYDTLPMFKYTYSMVNNNYFIELEQESIDEIDRILTDTTDEANLYYLVNKRSCVPKQCSTVATTFESKVMFKGVQQQGKIILPTVDYSTYEKRIHKDILDTVVNVIIEEFEEFLFNKINNYE